MTAVTFGYRCVCPSVISFHIDLRLGSLRVNVGRSVVGYEPREGTTAHDYVFFFVLRLGYGSHLDFFLFSAQVARGYFVIILHP